MKKELKDYVHFYLGCECKIANYQETFFIRMVNETGLSVCTETNLKGVPIWYKTNVCKPILRSLSDMTEEEGKEVGWQETKAKKVELTFEEFKQDLSEYMFFTPDEFSFLLKQGFDLFQLIEPDLAIDAKTLK